MAAYAAVVSLLNNMEQIMNHPRLSTCLDKKQMECLEEKARFLLDFIESCNSQGGISKEKAEDLESQIAAAGHAAEDVIESQIVDQILAGSTPYHSETSSIFKLDLEREIKHMKEMVKRVREKIRSKVDKSYRRKGPSFLPDLQKIIKDMDSIKQKIIKVKKERGLKHQMPTYSTSATSSRTLAIGKTAMVGFDHYLFQLKDQLIREKSNLQVIPIVGMGGIGKTTLAKSAFEDSLVMQFFDLRAWATISQNHSPRNIFLQLLSSLEEDRECCKELDQHELVDKLYKRLCGRRYLIMLDDIWGIEAWDNIKFAFPDNNNGSHILVTTRLTNMAAHLGSSYLAIDFLDEEKSWKLFCEKAFGHEEGCPPELEKPGRQIANSCKGLPLSISVIGGSLLKSSKSQEYWETVAKDTKSLLNSEGEEHCLNILSLSYSHLPAHLKPCFLYMGVFPEDDDIHAYRLTTFWVAEGFLKPNKDQSFEEIADAYLKDLVDRNIVLVRRWGSNGRIKSCSMHDLLIKLCLKVAKKEKFLGELCLGKKELLGGLFPSVMKLFDAPRVINRERRIVIHETIQTIFGLKVLYAHRSTLLARSLIYEGNLSFKFRLLRVLINASARGLPADLEYVNLRCIDRGFDGFRYAEIFQQAHSTLYLPREINLLWNLQILRIRRRGRIVVPSQIWEMRQLRHIKVEILKLPDPPPSDEVDVLQNLQTLGIAEDFRLSEEVCKRIPNIKKLKLIYNDFSSSCEASSHYHPHNFGKFHKLESLYFQFCEKPCWGNPVKSRYFVLKITFPSSLKKLSLYQSRLYWKELSFIGLLPNLEVLKLGFDSAIGGQWNPIEGEFPRLKFLKVWSCDLTEWNADNSHFPVLENLVLEGVYFLTEIPPGIGEIATLRLIRLYNLKLSCAISAMNILMEQESLGNDSLQLQIEFHPFNWNNLKRFGEEVKRVGLASNNLKYGVMQYY